MQVCKASSIFENQPMQFTISAGSGRKKDVILLAEKSFDKIQQPFVIKLLSTLERRECPQLHNEESHKTFSYYHT